MSAESFAVTSLERLRGLLLDRQAGKVVPQILIDRELALLTERVRAMPEPVIFDLELYRQRFGAQELTTIWPGEADEQPLAADGVAEESDDA